MWKTDWYAVADGSLWVNSVEAVTQVRLVDPSLRVTETAMVKALRAMSTGKRQAQRVKDKQIKMWQLDMAVVESWCNETKIADYEDVVNALKKQETKNAPPQH